MSPLLAVGGLQFELLSDPWVAAPVFAVLFSISFFFSGTEIAFFSLQALERQRLASSDHASDRLMDRLLSDRTSLITTVLMGNEFTNVAIATTGAALLATVSDEPGLLNIVVVTPALVLLSEITPKVLALRFNHRWARWAVWPITAVHYVLWPVRASLAAVVAALARLFGVTGDDTATPMSEEDLLVLVEQGAAQGVVDAEEREIIEAVFGFDDIAVSRLMTPRPDIVALDISAAWDEVYETCKACRYSRIPLYDGELDNLVGVLVVKDLLRVRHAPPATLHPLAERFLRPVVVSPSRMADDLMRELIRRRTHMGFVVDEHGTLTGLVTLDDLLSELVGDLADDRREPTEDITALADGLMVRANLDLEDLADATQIELEEGNYHTIAGFLLHALGHLPTAGDMVQTDSHTLRVHATDGNRVLLVHISERHPSAADASALAAGPEGGAA